jgi:hypothetical protein
LLELQSELELDMAFTTGLRAGNLAKVTRGLIVAWRAELRGVGNVRAFRPELHFDALGEWEVLEY